MMKKDRRKSLHRCAEQGWAHCCVCEGRIHLPDCTTLTHPNKQKDCCGARHKMLHDQGHVRGLDDSSFIMWTPDYPMGVHPNTLSTKALLEQFAKHCPKCNGTQLTTLNNRHPLRHRCLDCKHEFTEEKK